MSLIDNLKAELKRESVSTRKHLERVPEDKFDWAPHEKSTTLKALAVHIATITGMPAAILTKDELDLAQAKKPEIPNTAAIVDLFDKSLAATMEALDHADESEFSKKWILRAGDHVIMELPKGVILRMMGLSHVYHHRAQLGVYLRLLDVPVPSTYGPSADEN